MIESPLDIFVGRVGVQVRDRLHTRVKSLAWPLRRQVWRAVGPFEDRVVGELTKQGVFYVWKRLEAAYDAA